MMNLDTCDLMEQAKALATELEVGFCMSILNEKGQKEFFIRVGEIRPCSIELAEKKAVTAYEFSHDNHEIYRLLKSLGDMPLVSKAYCFIPGGKVVSSTSGIKYFLGISSSDPHKDLDIVNQLADYLD